MINFLYIIIALLITLPIATSGFYSKKNVPGAAVCLLLAAAAFYLGRLFPLAGGAVIAILLGLVLSGFGFGPQACKAGIAATSKKVLPSAIVLLGFQMNVSYILGSGGQALILIFVTIVTALLLSYFAGKAMRAGYNEQVLIGVGTAICGGSAIAAMAPIIKADEREIATAISTVFLFNVLAVFIFPAIGHLTSMGDMRFGVWCGAAINDTSSVVAAAYSYSDAAGNAAVVVKLTRTLFIIPMAVALAAIQGRRGQITDRLSIGKVFPWFVIAFLVACSINSFGVIPAQICAFWGGMGKFCIMMAMAAIGLSADPRGLISQGKRPVLLGGCCSLAVASASLVVQNFLNV